MDFEKIKMYTETMVAALTSIEKAMDIRQQTSRVRNMITSNDLDAVTVNSVRIVRLVSEEIKKEFGDE